MIEKAVPKWAVEERYEYDLDMSTGCALCGEFLREGTPVYRDINPFVWPIKGGVVKITDYYCSLACVLEADEEGK